MANPKVKEGFEIEEYTVIERDPKTENSFRILKVSKAIMKEVERRLHYVEMKKEWYAGNYEVMDEKDKIIAFMNDTFVPERTGTEG